MDTQIVGRGVDTLVLNVFFRDEQHKPCKRELPLELKEQLDAWKQAAIEAEEPIPVPLAFEGIDLHMFPNGAGKGQWRWLLTCASFNLLISMGRLNGVAQVRFSSEYLWSCGSLENAIVRVEEFLVHFFKTSLYLQVSEVHLCADIAGWDVESIDQRRDIVSRSRKRGTYEVTDLQIEDFSFGLNRSGFLFSRGGPMSCVIYDKTREIKQQSQKYWFYDIWSANGWAMEEYPVVWRVEFRFKREVLHELSSEGAFEGIEDAFQFSDHIQAMWAYATGHVGGGMDGLPDGWLRLAVPGSDTNRSRWVTHPVWALIQGAYTLPGQDVDRSEVVRFRKRQANIERGIAAIVGYLSSIGGWIGLDTNLVVGEVAWYSMLQWLEERVPVYLKQFEKNFRQDVEKKRIKFEVHRTREKERLEYIGSVHSWRRPGPVSLASVFGSVVLA